MTRVMDAVTSVSIPRISRPDDPQLVRAINMLAQQPLATSAAVDAASGSGGLVATAAKTANYTAVAGDLVVCNTSGGAFTVNLPASPATDARVGVYLGSTDGLSGVTIGRNGSTIQQTAADQSLTASGQYREYHYNGSTWVLVAKVT